jgi:hypothetical protein
VEIYTVEIYRSALNKTKESGGKVPNV